MNKNIWIINHYALEMYLQKGGRHYYIARELKKMGYNPIVICASTRHNSNEKIDIKGKFDIKIDDNGIKYIIIKTSFYKTNGIKRIINMFDFYNNLMKSYKKISKLCEKPNIIYASSVHPLALIAGEKIAKKNNIKCLCEIRDLWPESLIAYGYIKRNSLIAKFLYKMEKRIYVKADKIIMTWPGGKQYIIDKKWEKQVNLDKIIYISNGVSIENFDKNVINNKYEDKDLSNNNLTKVVYTGSIRKVNDISMLMETAKLLSLQDNKIKILIWGNGDEYNKINKTIKDEDIKCITMKGSVQKKYIPSILCQSDILILHNKETILNIYGQSQNKMFEYLAAGKPIIMTYSVLNSIIEKNNCGLELKEQNAKEIANAIICMTKKNETLLKEMGKNSRTVSLEYDYVKLTKKLIELMKNEGD